jgi:F-type H+-transporting ATPase subunit delta
MATTTDALATLYARSLYELADQAGGREKIFEVASELEQICECARGNREFTEFLASPIIEKQRRGDALGRIFGDRITDLTLRFLLVLNDKERLGHLEAINSAFDGLVQAAHGRVEVDVFTAATLEEDQAESLRERVGSAIGKEAVLHRYTDPAMIGGLKLRIGDQLIDGSVATRLRQIRQSLLTRGNTRIRERADRIIEEGTA